MPLHDLRHQLRPAGFGSIRRSRLARARLVRSSQGTRYGHRLGSGVPGGWSGWGQGLGVGSRGAVRGPCARLASRQDLPGIRDRAQVPELVGIEHRADRLDPAAEYVERQGIHDLSVAVAEDRTRLAVQFVRLHHDADPDERRDQRDEQPDHVLDAENAATPLRALPPRMVSRCGESVHQTLAVV